MVVRKRHSRTRRTKRRGGAHDSKRTRSRRQQSNRRTRRQIGGNPHKGYNDGAEFYTARAAKRQADDPYGRRFGVAKQPSWWRWFGIGESRDEQNRAAAAAAAAAERRREEYEEWSKQLEKETARDALEAESESARAAAAEQQK